MESSIHVNSILLNVITKLDYTLEPPGLEANARTMHFMKNILSKIIDELGEHSSATQGLKRVLTTVDKLRDFPSHLLYLLKDPNGHHGQGEVIGLLKVGKKHLYLYDEHDCVHEVEPLCVLDFFIKPERQHNGYGKYLFDHMLNDLQVDVNELAIDGPSPKMLHFLKRNYGIDQMIRQTNNFAVSPSFFTNYSRGGGKKLENKELPHAYGRYSAHRPASTVGGVIHGDNAHYDPHRLSPFADVVDSGSSEEKQQSTKAAGCASERQHSHESDSSMTTRQSENTVDHSRPNTLEVDVDTSAHPHSDTLPEHELAAGLPPNYGTPVAELTGARPDNQLTHRGYLDVKYFHSPLW